MSQAFKPIGLGDRARDPISGLVGIATSVTRYLTGSIRVGITPETVTKDGDPANPHDFDQSALILVKAGVHTPMVTGTKIALDLGDRIKCRISGFSGIVESATDFLHGCRRLGVGPETLHEGKSIAREYFDEPELELTAKAVLQPVALSVRPAPAPEQRRSNGGPTRETAGFRRDGIG